MSESVQDFSGSSEVRQFRSTKVAIVHGESFTGSNTTVKDVHYVLKELFEPLGIRVFSIHEMSQAGMRDLLSSQAYDVVGLIGEAEDFPQKNRNRKDTDSIILSFAPNAYFNDARTFLNSSDALILCQALKKDWLPEVSQVTYHFFESLVVPSLVNVDIADVRHIAKGIGIALNIVDDDARKIIARLPRECLIARSALLHFACKEDVRLAEVHAISKSFALKGGEIDPQLNSHADAKKLIRNVNVKMGIRILEENESSRSAEKRISMTAILFGI